MAIYKDSIIPIEMKNGQVHRCYTNRIIGEGDNKADRFGVRILKDGQPANLTGTSCIGFFIRPDGITLVLNGTISANEAYVDLPEAAYAVEGSFSLAIKISGTGFQETMRIVDGTIVSTTTGTIYDPSSEVPSLADLTAIIEDAEEAAAEIDAISVSAVQISGTRYKIAVTIEE